MDPVFLEKNLLKESLECSCNGTLWHFDHQSALRSNDWICRCLFVIVSWHEREHAGVTIACKSLQNFYEEDNFLLLLQHGV